MTEFPGRRLGCTRGVKTTSVVISEMAAVVTKADGTTVDLGVITSPYPDRYRNWLWKRWKSRQIRRKLGR